MSLPQQQAPAADDGAADNRAANEGANIEADDSEMANNGPANDGPANGSAKNGESKDVVMDGALDVGAANDEEARRGATDKGKQPATNVVSGPSASHTPSAADKGKRPATNIVPRRVTRYTPSELVMKLAYIFDYRRHRENPPEGCKCTFCENTLNSLTIRPGVREKVEEEAGKAFGLHLGKNRQLLAHLMDRDDFEGISRWFADFTRENVVLFKAGAVIEELAEEREKGDEARRLRDFWKVFEEMHGMGRDAAAD